MSRHLLIVLASAILAGCSWTPSSNWFLMDAGYSIDFDNAGEFAIEVHVNQLKQLGGDVNSAEFRLFVSERLKWHDMCQSGWAPLPCVEDGSCVQRTRRSITVKGRCAP
jgi:hypothetical protein